MLPLTASPLELSSRIDGHGNGTCIRNGQTKSPTTIPGSWRAIESARYAHSDGMAHICASWPSDCWKCAACSSQPGASICIATRPHRTTSRPFWMPFSDGRTSGTKSCGATNLGEPARKGTLAANTTSFCGTPKQRITHTTRRLRNLTTEGSNRTEFAGVEEFQDKIGWHTIVGMKDYWDVDMVGRTSKERVGYPTQNPFLCTNG